jgi:hypothetical protein
LSIVALSVLGLCLLCSLAKLAMKSGDKSKKHCDKACGALVFLAIVLLAVSQLLGETEKFACDTDHPIAHCLSCDNSGQYCQKDGCAPGYRPSSNSKTCVQFGPKPKPPPPPTPGPTAQCYNIPCQVTYGNTVITTTGSTKYLLPGMTVTDNTESTPWPVIEPAQIVSIDNTKQFTINSFTSKLPTWGGTYSINLTFGCVPGKYKNICGDGKCVKRCTSDSVCDGGECITDTVAPQCKFPYYCNYCHQ